MPSKPKRKPSDAARRSEEEDLRAIEARLRAMPPQSGLFLIFTGTLGGLCIPGLPGFAISLMGGLIVAPRVRWLNNADQWLRDHAPELRSEGLRFVDRFFSDLNHRFPPKGKS